MKKLDVYISSDAPGVRNALWLQPVSGGFVLRLLENGAWKSLKMVDDNGTISLSDDTAESVEDIKTELIGSVQDASSANTVNGAKAYAGAVGAELLGDPTDAATNMTLYGLKAYIDAQIADLG